MCKNSCSKKSSVCDAPAAPPAVARQCLKIGLLNYNSNAGQAADVVQQHTQAISALNKLAPNQFCFESVLKDATTESKFLSNTHELMYASGKVDGVVACPISGAMDPSTGAKPYKILQDNKIITADVRASSDAMTGNYDPSLNYISEKNSGYLVRLTATSRQYGEAAYLRYVGSGGGTVAAADKFTIYHDNSSFGKFGAEQLKRKLLSAGAAIGNLTIQSSGFSAPGALQKATFLITVSTANVAAINVLATANMGVRVAVHSFAGVSTNAVTLDGWLQTGPWYDNNAVGFQKWYSAEFFPKPEADISWDKQVRAFDGTMVVGLCLIIKSLYPSLDMVSDIIPFVCNVGATIPDTTSIPESVKQVLDYDGAANSCELEANGDLKSIVFREFTSSVAAVTPVATIEVLHLTAYP